ncbi:DUF6279 family lipoprotein [Vibrio natriegens]|uniref:DUF6279 family lipoprotein n=1 Tax=Vibrio natriegens TaxID=691 RepID=UPI000356EBD0|nr:DUF6279 family lipoprotein [Vibrio natriegens]EPM41078.1 hypothetical protein M272_01535 [Vibrio natriegens NBRC 15636 = ATCC 14048 = DSM 759]MDX6029274.1 DUF6279 family lipoprotein [Vibrio natriegens NBRC 15636 = ATCC 14048 = DSM 759]UUI14019.1 DUF6279 family lipoprotein [Vibrio natriegens]WRS51172.1 DUF6279 family lipoprotein [Vibrio natriegens NBRC 15636 = ATCC 14048 = DSM 759]
MIKLHDVSNKVLRYSLILVSIFLLAGCTKKFFYNNLDWFVLEYLDDYVTLNQEQESLLEERLLFLAEWHKQEELPRYVDHLKEMETMTEEDITLNYLQQSRERFREHYNRIISKVAPELFSLSLLLTPQQQREFLLNVQKDYKKRNAKYADKTEKEVRKIVFENTEEWVTEWIGELNDDQQRYVTQFSNQVILNSPLWRNYRASIYQEIEYMFDNKSNSVIYQKVFMQLMFEPESFYSDQLSQNMDHNLALVDQLTLSLSKSMTKKQWNHFRGEVAQWRSLAQELLD